MSKELLSFVIPCYRSEKTIESVVKEITDTCAQKSDLYDYEIILVCDASPDNVWSVIKKLAEGNKKISGICFSKNYGQHAALMAGFRKTKGDMVVVLDDDGQCPLESLYDLLDSVHSGNDIVFARYSQKAVGLFRRMGTAINKKMAEIMIEMPKNVDNTNFYVMKAFVAKEMVKYEHSYPYIGGLMTRTTRKFGNVDAVQRARLEGKSGYTLGKLIALWINGFTAFSVKPLRIATILGCLCAAAGFIAGIVFIIQKLLNPEVVLGFTTTISVILFIGGLQMLMLGLIGEYIGRIYICINKSPQYVIREEVNTDNTMEAAEE